MDDRSSSERATDRDRMPPSPGRGRPDGFWMLVLCGAFWVLAGAELGGLSLLQLGFADGYAIPDPGSALGNAAGAVACVLLGIAVVFRRRRSTLAVSIGAAALIMVGGTVQLAGGIGGWSLGLAVASAALGGLTSGAAATRPGRTAVPPMARRWSRPRGVVAPTPWIPRQTPDQDEAEHPSSELPSPEPPVTDALPPSPEPAGSSWLGAGLCLMLIALGVAVPLVLAAVSGSLEVAHNDDWAFRRMGMGLYQTGVIESIGVTQMNLVGLLLAAQPLLWLSGGSEWAFGATTALLSAAGVASAWYLLRCILPRGRALLGVLAFVLFPGVLVYTTAYMTDVPAVSADLACLAFGAAASRCHGRHRLVLYAASLAVGCFAFSIRDFGLAAPAAVIAFLVARTRFRDLGVLVLALLTAGTCLALHFWIQSLPGPRALLPFEPQLANLTYLRWPLPVIALAISPMVVLAVRSGWHRWRPLELALGLAVGMDIYNRDVTSVLTTGVIQRVLVGNLLEPQGAPGGVGAGYRPLPLDTPGWDILNLIALVATIVGFGVLSASVGALWRRGAFSSLGELLRRFGSVEGLLALFALAYGGGMVLFGLGAPIYDRYVWPLGVPLAGLLLLAGRSLSPRGPWVPIDLGIRAGTAALVGMLALTSTVLMLNGFAYDVAGWRMGQRAVELGYAPTTVDGGFAWVGFHATTAARTDIGLPPFNQLWPEFRLCALVASSELGDPAYHLVSVEPDAYRLYLVTGPDEPMYLYGVATPGCP